MADSEAIRRAIALVDGGMSQRAACRETGVPLATLQRRLRSRDASHATRDPWLRPVPHGRDASGRFLPGISGNPNGRRAERAEAIRIAEEHAPEAIREAIAIMRDEEAPAAVRLKAIEQILDRALGKPKQAVKLDADYTERHVYHVTQEILTEHPDLLDKLWPEAARRA